jgi:hypothetical protein
LNRYHIGVELEVESVRGGDRAEQAQKILAWTNSQGRDITAEHHPDQLMYAESDGSLAYGFELVTAPLGLDDQRNLWGTALSPANLKGLSSHNTSTCGLHVHISRAKLSQLQIAKIVFFVNNPANYGFIKAIARRYGSHYCKAKNIPLAKGHLNEDTDRYQLVNLCNRNTIEFRLFKGTLKLGSLLACVEFCCAVVAYCGDTSGGGFDMTALGFRRFIETPEQTADTVNLRAYLKDRPSITTEE